MTDLNPGWHIREQRRLHLLLRNAALEDARLSQPSPKPEAAPTNRR